MNKSTLRLSFPAFAWVISSLAFPLLIRAQAPVFTPDVNIDQTQLLAGKYPLRKVLESGGQFFTTPFIPVDGMVKAPLSGTDATKLT